MLNRRNWLRISIAFVFLLAYLAMIVLNLSESSRRTFQLTDEIAVADQVRVSITVTSVDPVARQVHARLRFRLTGNIAEDAATPKVPLKLFVNNSPGQTEFDFHPGETMTRMEVNFPLDGDLNRYPFDKYEAIIWLLITTPRSNKPQVSQVPQDTTTGNAEVAELGDEAVGEESLRQDLSVPLSISLLASTPGFRYSGELKRSEPFRYTNTFLHLRRSGRLINLSVWVMCMMMGLAITVVAMAIVAIGDHQKVDYLPLGMAISLIFGLPALRNMQPGVPAVGVIGDYFAFVWAEVGVALAAIIVGWTWVRNLRKKSQ